MSVLAPLTACTGAWRGTNTLQDPNTGRPEESPGTLTVTPVLGGRFVRLDYSWGYQGTPQEGSLLVGFDKGADAVTAHWIDSWHMGDRAMACLGTLPGDGPFTLRGVYPVSTGPDWGWRIDLTPLPDGPFRLVMYNVWPDGEREDLAVEAIYHRT